MSNRFIAGVLPAAAASWITTPHAQCPAAVNACNRSEIRVTWMILYQVALVVRSVLLRTNCTPAGPYAAFMTAIWAATVESAMLPLLLALPVPAGRGAKRRGHSVNCYHEQSVWTPCRPHQVVHCDQLEEARSFMQLVLKLLLCVSVTRGRA